MSKIKISLSYFYFFRLIGIFTPFPIGVCFATFEVLFTQTKNENVSALICLFGPHPPHMKQKSKNKCRKVRYLGHIFYFSDSLGYLPLSLQVVVSQFFLRDHDVNMRFKNIQGDILIDMAIGIICTRSLLVFANCIFE